CYHRIGKGGIPIYSWLDSDVFEAQIDYVSKHYRIVSLNELAEGVRHSSESQQAVAITFDDGYRDLYWQPPPILRKHRLPAPVDLTVEAHEPESVSWHARILRPLTGVPPRF